MTSHLDSNGCNESVQVCAYLMQALPEKAWSKGKNDQSGTHPEGGQDRIGIALEPEPAGVL